MSVTRHTHRVGVMAEGIDLRSYGAKNQIAGCNPQGKPSSKRGAIKKMEEKQRQRAQTLSTQKQRQREPEIRVLP
jgi:hypothetical protein